MVAWILANAATLVIGGLLLIAVLFAVRYVWKKTRAGQCIGCSGCDGDHGTDGCHCNTDSK